MRRTRPPRPQPTTAHRSRSRQARTRSKALLIRFTFAAVFLAGLLITLLLLHWRNSRNIGSSCSIADGRHSAGLDANLLKDIHQLRFQQQLLQAERDQLLGIQWTQVPFRNKSSGDHAGKPPLFLFLAVFSSQGSKARRSVVRQAWLHDAPSQGNIVAKFVLANAERDAASDAEAAAHGDILITDGALQGYRSIVYKTYYVLEHAVKHYDVRFIMKADEDAFVNVPALVAELKAACMSVGCQQERIYFGREIRNNVVRLEPGDKWQDVEYLNHTSLKTYMPYMMGGGYVLSADLARVILGINHQANSSSMLKFMPNEDVSIGFWLMSVELRRIDHPKVVTWGHPCCFERVKRRPGHPDDNRAWFQPTVDICREDWLILHKIEYSEEMTYLGHRIRQCARVRRLTDRARQLAVATRDTGGSLGPPDDQVERLSTADNLEHLQLAASPWSSSGTAVLATRQPAAIAKASNSTAHSTTAQIGMFVRAAGATWRWQLLDSSSAAQHAIGPRLQWLGSSSRHVAFNDLSCSTHLTPSVETQAHAVVGFGIAGGSAKAQPASSTAESTTDSGPCAVVFDVETMSRARQLSRPVYHVAPDGVTALTFDFRRIELLHPGEGYPVTTEEADILRQPGNGIDRCGLWRVHVLTGQEQLLVGYRRMFDATRSEVHRGGGLAPGAPPRLALDGCSHAVSHVQFNREGTSAVFQYHIGACNTSVVGTGGKAAWSYLFTVGEDGQHLWKVPLIPATALDYGQRGLLLVVAPMPAGKLHEVDVDARSVIAVKLPDAVSNSTVHGCKYFHDNTRSVACASSSHPAHKVFVWDRWINQVHIVGDFAARTPANSLHSAAPALAWSPTGQHLAYTSANNNRGQDILVAGIGQLGAAMIPSISHRQLSSDRGRRVLIVLGAGRGAAIRRWRRATAGAPGWVVHAWEPDPACHAALRALARSMSRSRLGSKGRDGGREPAMTVHPYAAWTRNGKVTMNTGEVTAQGHDHRGGSQRRRRWNKRLAQRLRQWRLGRTGITRGTMFAAAQSPATNITVPTLDFSEWLARSVVASDHVRLHLDIGGAEFEVLESLVASGALLLVDEIDVRWNDVFRSHLTEWPAFFTQVFAMLGVKDLSSSGTDASRLQ